MESLDYTQRPLVLDTQPNRKDPTMTDDTFTIDPNDPPPKLHIWALLGTTKTAAKIIQNNTRHIDGTPLTDAEARHIVNAIRKGDRDATR
jgi:hypothetical protein